MAIDEDIDKVREFADGITYPVLIDAQHLLTELYAISNVPTVVMIDEADRIVHPNWNAFATDTFREFTGIDSQAQLQQIREWVADDTVVLTEAESKDAVDDLSADEEMARLYFRIAIHLRDSGDKAGAARNFDRAAGLAPNDWTIRRAMLPLRGRDPFGQEFLDLYEEFTTAGRPYHGISGR